MKQACLPQLNLPKKSYATEMQSLKPYKILSGIYAFLMKDIDYDAWAEYLYDLTLDAEIFPRSVLEIAGGNGAIAARLSKKFDCRFILSDLSKEMLSLQITSLPKVACDMRALPFRREFDLIISTFDSVNYLLSENDLVKFFTEVSGILSDDGIFLFDVSLEKNSVNNAERFNRKGKFNGIQFEQKSFYDAERRVHTNEFFVEYENEKFYEKHEQRIYPFFDYFSFLEKAGLFAVDCFDAFTFDDATPESERAQFVVRKAR